MSITSKELAALAGVSRGTVDRALNHRGGVKPAVQQRIESLAREHGYRPNRAGRALVMREPLRVSILLNAAGNPFFDEVRRGLEAGVAAYSDFAVELNRREAKGYSLDTQLSQRDEAAAAGAAGIILTPLNHPEVADRLEALERKGCRVVTLNTDVEGCSRLAHVGCDYLGSGHAAAQMLGLLSRGECRVLIVTGSPRVLGHNQRIAGFSQVLREDFPGIMVAGVVENDDDDVESHRQVRRALEADTSIDALYFCAGGVPGGVRAALERGGPKPLIITCDTPPDTRRLIRDGLVEATIGQQPFWQGQTAMHTLLDALLFQKEPETRCLYSQNEVRIRYTL